MALLDNILGNGTLGVPIGNKELSASDKVVKLPNADSYNPGSMAGVYNPNAIDILGKAIGYADARQFLKTYNFIKDPSKALYLANLAQQIIWGVLPKNKVPTHVIQRDTPPDGGSFLDRLGDAAYKKAVSALKSAVNSVTSGLLSNLEADNREPVQKDDLTHPIFYGTGNDGGKHQRQPNTPWPSTYDGTNGSGSEAPFPVILPVTPLQETGGDIKDKKWRGDTFDDTKHKQTDIFEDGIKSPDIITNGGLKDKWTNYEEASDAGLKAKFNTSNPEIKSYTELVGPYGEKITGSSPSDIVKNAISVLGCGLGYRSWFGFEPGSDHMWDIQIYPYNGPDDAAQNTSSGPLNASPISSKTVTPALPSYKLPKFESYPGSGNESFSFGQFCPVLSYSLQFGSQRSKDLDLYNGDAVHMPMGFSYDMTMSINVLDDVYGSFNAWISEYMNKLYNVQLGKVVRYDQGAVIIRLIVFRNHYAPKYEFRFIAVPFNYSPQLEGDNSPNESQVHIDFNIVGIKKGMLSQKRVQNDVRNISNPTWTDVVIAPKKL